MKKIRLGINNVELYDSIEELPIVRFHKFNKMLLIDSGIGSDLTDFDRHAEKIGLCIQRGKNDDAMRELQNMRQNLYFVQQGISPKHMAFAVLVKKINDDECNDISDEGLRKILSILADTKRKDMTSSLDEVKKKIDDELMTYFPKLFEDSRTKEYYDKLKLRTTEMLRGIISGNANVEDSVKQITDDLILFSRPQKFSGNTNAEIVYDKQFEKMCLVLSQNLNVNPKTFSTLEYYNAYEYVEEQNREQVKKAKNRRY